MHDYTGELISIGVAFSWTATALLSEFGSKRLGNLTLNVLRMGLAIVFSMVLFVVASGSLLPSMASPQAVGWMLLSGVVGYVIGDFCLFQSYIIIGSRLGQLFMTLAPLAAAFMAWVTLCERLTSMGVVAMLITLSGISITILGRSEHHLLALNMPMRGVLFAVGAAVCQGIGLVLSKIGMEHYAVAADVPSWLVPFNANFYRCIAGIVGFMLLLVVRGEHNQLSHAVHDAKGLSVAVATTIFGPFVGVGFSLMAVQHTAAGIASTLMATTPIIILLPAHLLFHETISWRAVAGAVISVVGVGLFFLG